MSPGCLQLHLLKPSPRVSSTLQTSMGSATSAPCFPLPPLPVSWHLSLPTLCCGYTHGLPSPTVGGAQMAGTHLPFGSLSTQRRTLQRKRGYWLPEGKRLAVETSVPSQRTPGSILAVGRTRIRRPLAPNQGPPEESHRPRGSRHVIKTALTSCLTGEGTKPRFLPERSLQSQPSAAGRQTHARPESRLSTLAPRELNCHYVLGHDEITHEQELLILPKESEAAVGGGGLGRGTCPQQAH